MVAPWRVFDAPIFHPAPRALAFSEHMLGALPVTAPVYWVTRDPVVTHQALVLACFIASGVAMSALVRWWTRDPWAAGAAGIAYALSPLRVRHAPMVHLIATFWLPLALLWTSRFLADGRPRHAVLAGILLFLQAATSYAIAYPVFVAVGPFLLVYGFALGARPQRVAVLLVVVAAAAGVLALLSLPYLAMGPSGASPMFAAWEPGHMLATSGTSLASWVRPSSDVFLGVAPLAGSAAGLILLLMPVGRARPARMWAAAFGVVAFAMPLWLMATGPGGPVPGLAWIWAHVPGLQLYRQAMRFGLPLALPAAVLSGIAIAAAGGPGRRRTGPVLAVVFVVVLLVHDRPAIHLARVPTPATLSAAYRWLATLPAGARGPLVELPGGTVSPLTRRVADARAVYMSLYHGLPLVNGYSGYKPRAYDLLAGLLDLLPGPDALDTVRRLTAARWVLVHLGEFEPVERARFTGALPGVRSVRQFDDDLVLELEPPAEDWRERYRQPDGERSLEGSLAVTLSPLARARLAVRLPQAIVSDQMVVTTIDVGNAGPETWPALAVDPERRVGVEVVLEPVSSRRLPRYQVTVPLPRDLAPGEGARFEVPLRAPVAGKYVLGARVVQGGRGISTRGEPVAAPVEITRG